MGLFSKKDKTATSTSPRDKKAEKAEKKAKKNSKGAQPMPGEIHFSYVTSNPFIFRVDLLQ